MRVDVQFVIVAHVDRAAAAAFLQRKTGGMVFLDDGSLGEWENHARALRWAHASGEATHTVLLQDDAVLGRDFVARSTHAISRRPDSLISFYLGRGRPREWQERIERAILEADRFAAPWLSANALLHAVAIALPNDRIPEVLVPSRQPADHRIGLAFKHDEGGILYTWPSLVDHADGPTLVRHSDGEPRDEPRVAWRVGAQPRRGGRTVAI